MRKRISIILSLIMLVAVVLSCAIPVAAVDSPATVYEVGPGLAYTNITDVPLGSLKAGDTVNIHWRAEPYKEKFAISTSGTKENPITIRGIAGPEGQLPMIDGNGAKGGNNKRSVILITGPDDNYNLTSSYITIENLDISGANKSNKFIRSDKTQVAYQAAASAIYVERGDNIVVRNVAMHDCGNGFFVCSIDDPEWGSYTAKNILVEGCYIYNNGNAGSMYEHNSYCAAIGITYQYNHYGPLKSEAYGYGLKDRSAGTVVRYNWIEGGRRQISLDDGEDNPNIPLDPTYNDSYVYGNILVENDDGPIRLWGDDEILHFGGDNADTPDRSGTLHFYNNTVVTYRQAKTYTANSLDLVRAYPWDYAQSWTTLGRVERTCLFYLPSGQNVDVRNNIIYAAGSNPAPLTILGGAGNVDLSHNWISKDWTKSMDAGWVDSNVTGNTLTVIDDGTNLTGTDPKFVDVSSQDFRLLPGSPCVDAGAELNPAVIGGYNLMNEYVKHQSYQARPRSIAKPEDKHWDIGAFELPSGKALGEYMKNINTGK